MTEFVYKAPSEAEMRSIHARAHRMRAQAMSHALRKIAVWVRGLFAGGAGAPVHR